MYIVHDAGIISPFNTAHILLQSNSLVVVLSRIESIGNYSQLHL